MRSMILIVGFFWGGLFTITPAIADTAEQRGLFVFQHVCSACHGMEQAHYGDMAALTSSLPALQEWSKQHQANLESPIASPYPSIAVGKAANGGDFPPDLSHIARTIRGGTPYIEAILQDYHAPPPGMTLAAHAYYNPTALTHHHRFRMPPPLHDNMLIYPDGTKATVPQMAHDVTAFLQWSNDSHRKTRSIIGSCVLLYLVIMGGLLLALKKTTWSH
ncbi:ubiquinol-cytochrome C reductase [Saccharibacter sp. 17.LH.SD]|uniref:cytochrome c1 n=1 Tax=Saccharibacter sp. 17.LH.SD TaxID=2689393 RepID=UPI00136F4AF7|nr:cytochrome c1 [Saccharibacter sp. 17.LH.SD]MXV44956.1 ubiquinol-cytochrome C reductase [Saccharibacter sp. 17.LH.SD]